MRTQDCRTQVWLPGNQADRRHQEQQRNQMIVRPDKAGALMVIPGQHIGTAIFMISDGWMTTPTWSHRLAPLRASPNMATALSNATPIVYTRAAQRISVCGGTDAMAHINVKTSAALRI